MTEVKQIKYNCPCGSIIMNNNSSINKHNKSLKHIKYIDNIAKTEQKAEQKTEQKAEQKEEKTETVNKAQITDIDELLHKIAEWCISSKFYQKEIGYKSFNKKDILKISPEGLCKKIPNFSGYTFMEKECIETKEKQGMIRLYYGECNPKWSFWTTNGIINIDFA